MPSVHISRLILSHISLILQLFFPDESAPGPFWNHIYTALLVILRQPRMPTPSDSFPAFIQFLHTNLASLNPRSTSLILPYICECPSRHSISFLLCDFPAALNSPPLFFATLLDLFRDHPAVWIGFATNSGVLNLFLDRYIPLLSASPLRNDSACLLVTLLADIFLGFRCLISAPKKQSKLFLSRLNQILPGSETELLICAFRSFVAVYNSMWLEYKLRKRQELLADLLNATEYPSAVHHLAVRYVISLKCPKFRYVTMCKNLVRQGLREPRDVCWIEQLLMKEKVKKRQFGLTFLATTAASNRVWARCAVGALLQPLSRCHAQEEVKIWLPIFVKKLFVFLGVCLARKRYRNRQLMVAELLRALLTVEVSWLVRAISGCYAALISKRCCPFSLPVDLAGIAVDRTVIPEIELIANSQVKLKEFFTKTNFGRAVLPAAVGKAVARKIPGKAPKVAIAIPKVGARVPFRAMPSEESFK
jgi:hypothetical protein